MPSAAARAALESLLRARKLDTTLTSAFPADDPQDERAFAQTGLPGLDRQLGGGFPRGQISEVVGPRSSGRTSVLLAAIAAATGRGEVAALVDTLDRFDVASAAGAGIDLPRLLWIRGQAIAGAPPVGLRAGRGLPAPRALVSRAIDRALKAVNLVLQAGGFGVVALDFADLPLEAVRGIPFTTWLRLQRVVEGRETAVVLLGPAPIARSAGGVTIQLRPVSRARGARDVRLIDGFDIEARILRARRGMEDRQCTIDARAMAS